MQIAFEYSSNLAFLSNKIVSLTLKTSLKIDTAKLNMFFGFFLFFFHSTPAAMLPTMQYSHRQIAGKTQVCFCSTG